jgi:tRNA pseudouridine55 synthase
MDGILNIHKPLGMTSFDVVARVRRLTGTKKVGHTGTLDPDAQGVLPVCVGRATKMIEFLMDKDKAYRVGLLLGSTTDTQDASGTLLEEKPVEASFEEIQRTILSFVGRREQIPPMYSAIKVNGQKLYELARQGVEIERKPRTVHFYSISLIHMERKADKVSVVMDVECSKGTYMRTLCHDIGRALGCGGIMESLIRTRSGPFTLEQSYTLEDLIRLKEENKLETALMAPDQAVLSLPAVKVSDRDAQRLRNGLTVKLSKPEGFKDFIRVYHEKGHFLAVGRMLEKGDTTELKSCKWMDSL